MKILVIQQKMIGDVLTSGLICENLKKNFPNAEIHYLINRFTLPVVENHPYVDEFVIFEQEYRHSKITFYKFLKSISKAQYTHVFDAYSKLESLLITIFSKAKHKFSFNKNYTKFFYSETIKVNKLPTTEAGTAIENRLGLLKLLPNFQIYNNKPQIYLTSEEQKQAKIKLNKIIEGNKKCIMISALGSSYSKTYPLPYMAQILDLIASESNAHLILNYVANQKPEIDKLVKLCKPITQKRMITDIKIKSLREFIGVCNHCDAIIGNEGGSINIAKALEVPSFAIFSPWIMKEGWNSFEKSYPNFSVHISDYDKGIFKTKSIKYLKHNFRKYYQQLKPEMFTDDLKSFLQTYV